MFYLFIKKKSSKSGNSFGETRSLYANINDTTTVKIMSTVRQRKVIESFLIKNVKNMNVYQCSINFDHFTSSILLNNVPSLRNFFNSLENGLVFVCLTFFSLFLLLLIFIIIIIFFPFNIHVYIIFSYPRLYLYVCVCVFITKLW